MSRSIGKIKRDWREFLTPMEQKAIKRSDAILQKMSVLRDEYEAEFARDRQMIVNRATQRAKHAAREKLGMSEVEK